MMEIPYTVHNRPDTGVYNAKVGMWLFLASEVMLFGGLFSSYIFLRVGAPPDTWPHGWLNVTLGTINTIILALSAITTLLAWASLKIKDFPKYKLYHGLTILLAITFLGIKSYEYVDKFNHYTVTLADGRLVDGHLIKAKTNADQVVLQGRYVAGRAELLDGHAAHRAQHEEIVIPRSQITRMQNYGPAYNNFTAIYFTLSGLHALHILGGVMVIAWLWGPGSAMWLTAPEQFTNRVEVSGLFWHFVDLVWIFLFPVLYLT